MKNVNPEEIQKFDAISSQWWNPQGPFKPLHEINPLRIEFILSCLKNSISNMNILDIGCGGGILTEALDQLGANVTGIDASLAAIHVAQAHAKKNHLNINYIHTSAEQFLSQKSFDIITCMELLEHVPDPASVVAACARLVKPGGIIFFSTINRNLKSFLFAIVSAEYLLGLIPKGTHEYAKFIRPSELQKMAITAELSITHIKGISYSPLFKSYALTDNIDINYLVTVQKPNPLTQ